MKIGYVPYSRDLNQPADRRRFPYYAERRGIEFELAELEGDYDVVVVTPRADLARWTNYKPGRAKIVFDIVDSYLDVPKTDPKAILRGPAKFLAGESRTPVFSWRRAVERILERATAATCATPEQAAAISRFCPNVHPILDFQTRMVSNVKQDYAAGTPFKLVWEGLGENVRWFSEIRGPLAHVARQRPLVLHLITAVRFKQLSQRFWTRETAAIAASFFDHVEVHQWTEDSVAQIATGCDLAVIPLPLGRPLEAGKPESKLISFWRMGLPTITSSTPAYRRVMEAAGQALHCASAGEWAAALERLTSDESARQRAGCGGRAFAEHAYGDERLLAKWDRVLETL
jgi:glycosyltransferase involved in cell wall biosynthesis